MGVKRKLADLHRRTRKLNRKKSKRRKAKADGQHQYETLEPRRVLNSVPVANADLHYYTPAGNDLFVDTGIGLLANDFDLEQDSLGVEGGLTKKAKFFTPTDQGGSLIAYETGAFQYIPPSGFTGFDSFQYQAEDEFSLSPPVQVNIAVGTGLTAQLNPAEYTNDNFLHSGVLQTQQPLGGGLQLNYRSDSIPTPIIAVETSLIPGTAIPDSISATPMIDGIVGGTTVYNTNNLDPDETLRFVQRVVAPDLDTGVYDWTMTVTLHYDGAADIVHEFTGQQAVVNRAGSEFGVGWWLDGYDQIVPVDGGALLVNADGQTYFFESEDGEYRPAVGDQTYSILVNTGNGLVLTDKWGDERRFDTSGRLIAVKRLNNVVDEFTFQYSTDRLQTITDQFGRTYDFSYDVDGNLNTVNDFADRDTSIDISPDGVLNQVIVANEPATADYPDYVPPEWNYDYVKIGGQYYVESISDPVNGNTSYDYKLATRRIRAIEYADGSRARLYPALTQGYAFGEASLQDASQINPRYVDASGDVYRFNTDAVGNTTYRHNADGTVETYDYDLYSQLIRHAEAASISDAPIPVSELGYSESGNLVLLITNDGLVHSGEYDDALQRVTQWEIEDTTTQTTQLETFQYDSLGNLVEYTNAGGEVRTYVHDDHGNLLSETRLDTDGSGPLEEIFTSYSHDQIIHSLVTAIVIDGETVRHFEYSSADNPVSADSSLTGLSTFVYDPADRVVDFNDPAEDYSIPFGFRHSISTSNNDGYFASSLAVLDDGFNWPIQSLDFDEEIGVDLQVTSIGQASLYSDSLGYQLGLDGTGDTSCGIAGLVPTSCGGSVLVVEQTPPTFGGGNSNPSGPPPEPPPPPCYIEHHGEFPLPCPWRVYLDSSLANYSISEQGQVIQAQEGEDVTFYVGLEPGRPFLFFPLHAFPGEITITLEFDAIGDFSAEYSVDYELTPNTGNYSIDPVLGTLELTLDSHDFYVEHAHSGLGRIPVLASIAEDGVGENIESFEIRIVDIDLNLEILEYFAPHPIYIDQHGITTRIVDATSPNIEPSFTSIPETVATVGSSYTYLSTASDTNGDSLIFDVGSVVYPNGYDPPPASEIQFQYHSEYPDQYGLYTWTPPTELAGQTVVVEETVWDQIGNPVSRNFEIYVQPEAGNNAPVITSDPIENHQVPFSFDGVDLGVDFNPDFEDGVVDTEFIALTLANGEEVQVDVTVDPNFDGPRSADVIIAIDLSGSMEEAVAWLAGDSANVGALQQIENQLQLLGITNNNYGLVVFGYIDSPMGNDGDVSNNMSDLGDVVYQPTAIAVGNVVESNPQQLFDVPVEFDAQYNNGLGGYDPAQYWGTASQLTALLSHEANQPNGGIELGQQAIARIFDTAPVTVEGQPMQLPFQFRGEAITDIVLITDQPTLFYEDQVQTDILNVLQGDENTNSDDILFTTVALSRLAGNDGNGNVANYVQNGIPGNYAATNPDSPDHFVISPVDLNQGDLISVFDVNEYNQQTDHLCQYRYTCEISTTDYIHTSAFANWSAELDFTINDLGAGFDQNARVVFGLSGSLNGNAPEDYWYLEADAISDTWSIGSSDGHHHTFELHDGVNWPNLKPGENISVELRLLTVDAPSLGDNQVLVEIPRFDLFINGQPIGVTIASEYIIPVGANSISFFGVGTDNSGASFDKIAIRSFDASKLNAAAIGSAEPTPLDFSELRAPARQVYFNDFGTNGSSFDPTIIGADFGGAAYRLSDNGDDTFSIERLSNPQVARAFEYTQLHYTGLSESVQGSVWSLSQLRTVIAFEGDQDLEEVVYTPPEGLIPAFSQAFAESVARDIFTQHVTLAADSEIVTNIEPVFDDLDSATELTFRVTFTGNGNTESFELQFAQNNSPDHVLGTIPVFVSAGYSHDFVVSDYENDLPYEIYFDPNFEVPTGAYLTDSDNDETVGGRLIWEVPDIANAQDFHFRILVRDSAGSIGSKNWTVTLSPSDLPTQNTDPEIERFHFSPDVDDLDGFIDDLVLPMAEELQGYSFGIPAFDIDPGQNLRYFLRPAEGASEVPSWLRIDRNTGVLSGRPGTNDVGYAHFQVLVTDDQLTNYGPPIGIDVGRDYATFKINVIERDDINLVPQIEPIPGFLIRAFSQFVYQVNASDPDNDTLTYSIQTSVEGISIDREQGVISWSPTEDDADQLIPITVVVSDGEASATEYFELFVSPNNRPPIVTTELPDSVSYKEYRHPLTADDADGNVVRFSLLNAPDETVEIQQGEFPEQQTLVWPDPVPGTHLFGLRATDGAGGIVDRYYYVTFEENGPPHLELLDGNELFRESISRVDIGELGDGVALHANAAGTGYLLFTALANSENSQLVTLPSGNAEHLLVTRYNAGWEFSNGTNWVPFTPDFFEDRVLGTIDFDSLSEEGFYDFLSIDTGMTHGVDSGLTATNLRLFNDSGDQTSFPGLAVTGSYFDARPSYSYYFSLTSKTELDPTSDVSIDFLSANRGMTLRLVGQDNQVSGYYKYDFAIDWNPQYVGTYEVTLTASNGSSIDNVARHEIAIDVLPNVTQVQNMAPVIPDDFLGPFAVDSLVVLPLGIYDAEGHPLEYQVSASPGLQTPEITEDGVLRVEPDRSGLYYITVTASESQSNGIDGWGASTTHIYPVFVEENALPVVHYGDPGYVSAVDDDAYVYEYEFFVSDPNEGDPLFVTLNDEASDAGASVDPVEGSEDKWVLRWTNTDIQDWIGTGDLPQQLPVVIEVFDAYQEVNRFGFNLPVFDPTIVELPDYEFTIPAEQLWQFPISVNVPADASIVYNLIPTDETGIPTGGDLPGDLSVSQFGLIQWQPTVDLIPSQQQHTEFYFDLEVIVDGVPVTSSMVINLVHPDFYDDPVVPEIDEFTTPPPTHAYLGQTLTYQPVLVEQLDEPVTWHLDDGPDGATVHPETGLLTWTVTDDYLNERERFRLRASTLNSGSSLTFFVNVRAENTAPFITNSFPSIWAVDSVFDLQVNSFDVEGDEVQYELIDNNTGLAIDGNGYISGQTPVAVGSYNFTVRVSEIFHPESATEYVVNLSVTDEAFNYQPLFENYPNNARAYVGNQFRFDFEVIDPDQPVNENHIFNIVYPDSTEAILTGADLNEFVWTPSLDDLGRNTFQVSVRDSSPNSSPDNIQFATFDIIVLDNNVPEITSIGEATANELSLFVFQINAFDADADQLTYRIDANSQNTLPAGLTVNSETGLLRWQVPQSPSGEHEFTIIVQDELGASAEQNFVLTVDSNDYLAPTISVYIVDQYGDVVSQGSEIDASIWQTYQLVAEVLDTYPGGNFDLFVRNTAAEEFSLEDQQFGRYTLSFANDGSNVGINQGQLEIEVIATDEAENTSTQLLRYSIFDPQSAHIAAFHNLTDEMGPLTERFVVEGNAHHEDVFDNQAVYDLKLTSLSNPDDFIYLAKDKPAFVTDSPLGAIEVQNIPSGFYRVYLEVRCGNGQIQGVDEHIIEIQNDTSLSNLELAFTDLEVSLGGVPIPFVRTYNSGVVGLTHDGSGGSFTSDFSPGWNLNFLQSSLSVSHPEGITTGVNQAFAHDTRILVTLPDGSEHRFTFDPIPEDGGRFIPYLNPEGGQQSELSLLGVTENLLFVLDTDRNDGTYRSVSDNLLSIPANFGTAFVLHTDNGLKYVFDINTGVLTAIEDYNGARVDIRRSNVIEMNEIVGHEVRLSVQGTGSSNSGAIEDGNSTEDVIIHLGDQKRVRRIEDLNLQIDGPDGQSVIYSYAFDDDMTMTSGEVDVLERVTRRSLDEVSYTYHSQFKGHLQQVLDNAGVPILIADYFDNQDVDADDEDEIAEEHLGTLKSIENANGVPTDFAATLSLGDGRFVRTTQSAGITVEEVVDGRGNLLAVLRLVHQDEANADNNRYLVTVSEYLPLRGLLTRQSVPFYIRVGDFVDPATGNVDALLRFDALPPDPPNPEAGYDPETDHRRWSVVNVWDPMIDRLTSSQDATGGITTYYYGDGDGVFRTTDPYGITSNRITDPTSGRLIETFTTTSESDARYNHIRYQYNSYGHQTAEIQVLADGSEIVLSTSGYDSDGFLIWTESLNNPREYYSYNHNGHRQYTWREVSQPGDLTTITQVDFIQFDLDDQPQGNSIFSVSIDGDSALASNVTVEIRNTTSYDLDNFDELELLVQNFINPDEVSADVYLVSELATFENVRGQTVRSERVAVDSLGGQTRFVTLSVYDALGQITHQTDEFVEGLDPSQITGVINTYDAQGRVTKSERVVGLDIVVQDDGSNGVMSLLNDDPMAQPHRVLSYTETFYDAGRIDSSVSFSTDSTDLADGLKTIYSYNLKGQTTRTVTEAFDGNGQKVRYVSYTLFDGLDRPYLQSDEVLANESSQQNASNVTVFTYTPVETVYATRTEFDPFTGQATKTEQLEGVEISFDIDTFDNQLVDGGVVRTSTQTFYDLGRVIQTITFDQQGDEHQRTGYGYDALGRQVATVTAAVSVAGSQTQQRHRTESVYDDRGRVSVQRSNIVHYVDGNHDYSNVQETTYEYDDAGNLIRTEYNDGSYVLVRLDSLGRRIAESHQVHLDSAGELVNLEWSSDDQSYFYIDSETEEFVFVPTQLMEYDSQGRLISVSLPWIQDYHDNDGDGDTTDLIRPDYQYEYSVRGNRTAIIDPLDHETRFTFDEFGRQETRTLPLGFGLDGIQGTMDDGAAEPFSESFEYDDYGRQVLHITFEGVYWVNVYDDITGRLTDQHFFNDAASYNDGNGTPDARREFEFDDHGRRHIVREFIGNNETRVETFTYTDLGQVESIESEEGFIFYEYDEFGRLAKTSFNGPEFDNGGDDTNFENAKTYTYDELGRLATVSEIERNDQPVPNDEQQTSYQYDLIGNLDRTEYSNGLIHDYEYDDLNRLTDLFHWIDLDDDGERNPDSNSGETRAWYHYTLRADGKRVLAEEQLRDADGNQILNQEFDYTYDSLGRLIGEELSGNDEVEYVDAFIYDLAGNRTSTTRDWNTAPFGEYSYTTTYEYDANDRLLEETKDFDPVFVDDEVTVYEYDKTQQSSKTVYEDSIQTSNRKSLEEFEYTLEGRLQKIKKSTFASDGTTLTNYTETTLEYDSAGNRIASEYGVSNDGDTTIDSSTRTEYLTDTQNHTGYSQVLKETQTADGSIVKEIVYVIGHDQISQTVINDPDGSPTTETHFFGVDGHGSVRVLYDLAAAIAQDAQNVLQSYQYDAYGNLLNFGSATPLTSYQYNSEVRNHNTGYLHFRAREYDPTNGRFIGLDPFYGNAQDPLSFHKYAYVHGDPVNNIDPTGEFILALGGLVRTAAVNLAQSVLYSSIIGTSFSALAGGFVFSKYFGGSFGEGATVGLSTFWAYNTLRIQGAKPSRYAEVTFAGLLQGAVTAATKFTEELANGTAPRPFPNSPDDWTAEEINQFISGISETAYIREVLKGFSSGALSNSIQGLVKVDAENVGLKVVISGGTSAFKSIIEDFGNYLAGEDVELGQAAEDAVVAGVTSAIINSTSIVKLNDQDGAVANFIKPFAAYGAKQIVGLVADGIRAIINRG